MSEPYGTVRWFGESWQAPVCDPANHVDTPVGQPCVECAAAIGHGSQGLLIPWVGLGGARPSPLAFHLDCFLTTIGAPGVGP